MCIMSVVVDDWQRGLNQIQWTPTYPDPATAQQMLDVIKRLEALDKKMDALECKLKAPVKEAFKRKLKRRAAKK